MAHVGDSQERTFVPKMLRVMGGSAASLEPVGFSGRIDELTLEKLIVEDPSLVGEPLLVLGRQLADFQEDQDRLDVLAVDETGELVLIELKVSERFRVTDLQALAYAGAYATLTPKELAKTLARHSSGSGQTETASAIKQAEGALVEFLGLDGFEEWTPSQRVRIKLVAPGFPRRVLKTVKWLGDVYGFPIEAIAARLFEHGEADYAVAFERLLPLPGERAFDLTVRQREEARSKDNTTRNRSVVPLLLEHGVLQPGQTLYLAPTALPAEHRDVWNSADIAFQVRVSVRGGGSPRFAWRERLEASEQEMVPSAVIHQVYAARFKWDGEAFSSPVAPHFTVEPGGDTLGTIAVQRGLWNG